MIKMFNLGFNSKLYLQLQYHLASRHRVYDTKNNSIIIVEDSENKLPYMSEVQLSDLSKGVVMKIQDKGRVYLAMYDQFQNLTTNNQIQITNVRRSWKESLNPLIQQQTLKSQSQLKGTSSYDVNLVKISPSFQRQPSITNQQEEVNYSESTINNGNKRRLLSSSPILNICHDLYYGDMISFMGCRGSNKSSNSCNIAKQFSLSSQSNLAVYLNPNIQQTKLFTQICPSSISFTLPQHKKPTDAGVYMLTLKAIKLSSQLKKKGLNVLLIVDNFSDIMYRQWNLLQSIKFDSKLVDSSKIFQYNSLKIPPVSILNQIYSHCEDNLSEKNKPRLSQHKSGSMTSIVISEKENNDLVQQITSYSNNLKHLQTLSYVIEFPLDLKINTNLYYPKAKSQQQLEGFKQSKGFEQKELHRFMRSFINKFLNERRQTELKLKLYRNDIKEAPWDYFFLLDSEWWFNGIKQISNTCKSFKEANQFLRWIVYNIQNDYLGHWNLSAYQSYQKLIQYSRIQHNLQEATSIQKLSLQPQDLDAFIQQAKLEGLINPFKKDYLI